MTEPTVQVPVSLGTRLLEGRETVADLRELRSLLSQPTPTAGTERVVITRNQIENGVREVLDDGWPEPDEAAALVIAAILGRAQWLPTAAPPSVADMAPGTRPCADPNVNRWHFMRDADGNCPLAKCVERSANIDPSTIRDVTPPKEPS